MDFSFTEEQHAVRDAVTRICSRFDDDYWLERDREGGFPHEFYDALATEGWLGICTPETQGGAGLGIAEAAIMMRTVSESGAGLSGASAVHINIFGLNPVAVFGTEEQKGRMITPVAKGRAKACFAVTEPNTGLNTNQLKLKADPAKCIRKGGSTLDFTVPQDIVLGSCQGDDADRWMISWSEYH